jgi:CheY-like chemotaxis protein
MSKSNFKVLLVDDSETDYFLANHYLSAYDACDFEIDWANNYNDGLEKMMSDEYDFCMLDYHLGEKTGVDLAKAAQEFGSVKPVVFYSGSDVESVVSNIVSKDKLGNIIGFISKFNLSTAAIIKELRQVIDPNQKPLLNKASLEPLIAFDKDGKILLMNDALKKHDFFAIEDIIGTDAAAFFNTPELVGLNRDNCDKQKIINMHVRIKGRDRYRIIWNLIPVQQDDMPDICFVAKGKLQKRLRRKSQKQSLGIFARLRNLYNAPTYMEIHGSYYPRGSLH